VSGDEEGTVQSSGPLFFREVEGEVSGLVEALVVALFCDEKASSTSWSPLISGIVDNFFLAVRR
jgi:hypothetical protein